MTMTPTTDDDPSNKSSNMQSTAGSTTPRTAMAETIQNSVRVLNTKASGVLGKGTSVTTATDRRLVEEAHIRGIIFPWNRSYQFWWSLTVIAAIVTGFFEPFMLAFQKELGTPQGAGAIIEYVLTGIFVVDIIVNFNLAFYKDEQIVFERKQIAKAYLKRMFWIDLVGVFPFYAIALKIARDDASTRTMLLCGLFRLLKLVRLHRMKKLFHDMQYNSHISLMGFTLIRNLSVALFVTHFSACIMYFLARLDDFSDNTWLGPLVLDLNGFERYCTSLYWSITTFTTVGYGDFSPVNYVEQIWGMIFMLLNIVIASWIIGSITLLILKNDENTGEYRDSLQTLCQYSDMHGFDENLQKKLKTQLKLEFNNREISDEQVLKHFPSAVRRKVLRKLYLPSLLKTKLMKGVRQEFVDSFLTTCSVEIFSPGEVIVERGSISSDLFLLVGGIVEVTTPDRSTVTDETFRSLKESDMLASMHSVRGRQLEAGDFIGEIGFFTESPQIDSVSCLTVCKTLTMSRSAYKLIAQDHPGSAGKILQNLLAKVEEMQAVLLPKNLDLLRAGSVFFPEAQGPELRDTGTSYGSFDAKKDEAIAKEQESLTAVQDLVEMHMSKQKDDHTTRFLFAASRGDTGTITLMCDQNFDPDSADYDSRTALMVASMKGNTDVVKKLLEYKADPNLTDMHGSSALYEAVKNGNELTVDLLMEHGAKLCMEDSQAASILCQAVFDGDILLLRRLLRAGIQVNASDYDKRTAAHIAAAEGNIAALRTLVEYGADLTLKDRWGNTVDDEAKREKAGKVLDFLKTAKADSTS